MTSKPLKVAILSHSDNIGGAAVVTMRLHNALRREGVDSSMIVFTQINPEADVSPLSSRFSRGYHFMKERMRIFLANGMNRRNLFKVSIANTGPSLLSNPIIKNADVVVMSWVNQGMVSLKQVRKLLRSGKPVVWIMHDMWNMTGICHHALSCERYKDPQQCGCCPFLNSNSQNDLSQEGVRL